MPTIEQMEKEKKVVADYVLEWHKQYGPVIKFQILDNLIVSSVDPESIKVMAGII